MSFDVVRKNIIDLLEANDRLDRPVPVNFRIKTLKTMAETLDHEFFNIIQSHQCTIALTPIDNNIISNWAGRFDKDGFLNRYGMDSGKAVRFNHKRFNLTNTAPCTQLWKWMVVYWDGSVVLCCADMFFQRAGGEPPGRRYCRCMGRDGFNGAQKKNDRPETLRNPHLPELRYSFELASSEKRLRFQRGTLYRKISLATQHGEEKPATQGA